MLPLYGVVTQLSVVYVRKGGWSRYIVPLPIQVEFPPIRTIWRRPSRERRT